MGAPSRRQKPNRPENNKPDIRRTRHQQTPRRKHRPERTGRPEEPSDRTKQRTGAEQIGAGETCHGKRTFHFTKNSSFVKQVNFVCFKHSKWPFWRVCFTFAVVRFCNVIFWKPRFCIVNIELGRFTAFLLFLLLAKVVLLIQTARNLVAKRAPTPNGSTWLCKATRHKVILPGIEPRGAALTGRRAIR